MTSPRHRSPTRPKFPYPKLQARLRTNAPSSSNSQLNAHALQCAGMDSLAQFIGESPAMLALRESVRRFVERPSGFHRLPHVLILGETGTGKSFLARAMHAASNRAAGPFVEVNCAAIPETLLESEMFGYERGAFTDARQSKSGLFQTAHGGTLFLDEIALMPESMQAKLLSTLDSGVVRRIGAVRSEPVDVWVIAATNEDLAAALGQRRFRADLYHRLAAVTFSLAPLRDRLDDVLLLADAALTQICRRFDLPLKFLTPAARDALRAYTWPGNVRELNSILERAVLLATTSHITPTDLALPTSISQAEPDTSYDTQRERLLTTLRHADWSTRRAALLLGISRATLYRRLQQYGISLPAVARSKDTLDPSVLPSILAALHVESLTDLASRPVFLAPVSASVRLHPFVKDAVRAFELTAHFADQYIALTARHRKRDALTKALTTISTLQRSLADDITPAATELRPLALDWAAILTAEHEMFVAHETSAQELPNPFVFGDPVAPTDYNIFSGRRDLVHQVEANILSSAQPPTLLLHGPRRMGKTSVLNQLPRLLGPDCAPAFLDCQAPAVVESLTTLLRYLSTAIASALQTRHIDAAPLTASQLDREPFTAFQDWLMPIEKRLPARFRVLLSFDEYERLEQTLHYDWGHAFLDLLRHLSQHHRCVALLFSGVRTFVQLGPTWASRFVHARPIRVTFLKHDEALLLLTNPIPDFPLTYEPAALNALIGATNGQPFLTQAVAFELVELLNARGKTHAILDSVETAIASALISAEAYFANVWNDIGPEGRAVLRPLASLAVPPDRPEVLAHLQGYDVLTDSGTFAVPMVRQWILQHGLS